MAAIGRERIVQLFHAHGIGQRDGAGESVGVDFHAGIVALAEIGEEPWAAGAAGIWSRGEGGEGGRGIGFRREGGGRGGGGEQEA